VEILTKNDIIFSWGGTRDVGKNNSSNGLKHAVDYVKNNTHAIP
jgi:hypothetical protein